MNYVAYHVHDDCSLLDSCTKYTEYIDRAVELGQKAIAITNHGNVYNWLERKIYAEERGIKMLTGMECYITEDACDGTETEKHRDNYHTILIAKNPDGEKELFRLFDTSSKPDHQYYNKRISMNELFALSDNIYKISACLASPLNKLRNKPDKAELLDKLLSVYDYYEIQPHNNVDQKEYNLWLYEMSKKYSKPLIAATDTHSLNQYKAECRKILMLAKNIKYATEDESDLTYKSYDELCEMFRAQDILPEDVWLEAIENTNVMADSVIPSEIDRTLKYPELYGDKDEQVLQERVDRMYKEKVDKGIIEDTPEFRARIQEEMTVFKQVNYIGFMLFMSEMATWCWDNGIPLGFCRGSVGGSAVAYIIDIIDVNPMRWNTVFSRFCNLDRAGTEVGDIDIDISPSQRSLVQEYIMNRFGVDKTGYVLSIGTISDKGTIDEIGRALNYPLNKVVQIKDEYGSNPDATKEKYAELFYYFDGLNGTNISQSMHPAGVIASPISLTDNYGSFWNDGKHILAINMEEAHVLQLAKYDCLGLKNIEIIKDCCEYAGIKYPKSHEIDWEDKAVWEHITDSPIGIFQFEGEYAFGLLKRYKPTMITHMSTVNASLRPSGESYREALISHKPCKNPSPMIDELLKDNDGYLIFQEDTIKFLQNICGLTGAEADNVRRAIGRKQVDRLQAALPKILDGYCKMSPQPREVAEQEAKQFLQIIEDSASYQFGYNHSTGYSMVGYLCGYLRYYYPLEFIAAYLKNADGEKDIANGTELAKQLGIEIKPIKFRHSSDKYTCDKPNKTIYKSVSSVKYLNSAVAKVLYDMRDWHFDSFIDFLKVNPCNTRQTEILVRLDFFSEFGKSAKLLAIHDLFQKFFSRKDGGYVSKKSIKKTAIEPFSIEQLNQLCTKETATAYQFDDLTPLIAEYTLTINDEDITPVEKIEAQLEYLGYIAATGRESDRRIGYVRAVYPCKRKADNKTWAYKVSVTFLGKGKDSDLTIYKVRYDKCKLQKGDIFYAESVAPKDYQGRRYWYLMDYHKI